MANKVDGVKEGILLEAGFDNVTPNAPVSVSSWAFEKAHELKVDVKDNQAIDIICYHPGYTLVEKLQTIATKFRNEQSSGKKGVNFMRQYYDVFCLLGSPEVLEFISKEEYQVHKKNRFPTVDYEIPIPKNEAFLLSSPEIRADFTARYKTTAALYYQGQQDFEELIDRIAKHIEKL